MTEVKTLTNRLSKLYELHDKTRVAMLGVDVQLQREFKYLLNRVEDEIHSVRNSLAKLSAVV